MDTFANLSYLGLSILLPWMTYTQLRKYSEQPYNLSVLKKGLASKRWLFENITLLLYILCLIIFTITDLYKVTDTNAFIGWLLPIRIVWIVTTVSI